MYIWLTELSQTLSRTGLTRSDDLKQCPTCMTRNSQGAPGGYKVRSGVDVLGLEAQIGRRSVPRFPLLLFRSLYTGLIYKAPSPKATISPIKCF